MLLPMPEKTEVKWTAPEFEPREKGAVWYWITMLIAAAFMALSVWQKNYFFIIFIIIAEILVLVWGGREPEMVEFTLTEKELAIGGRKFYKLDQIEKWSGEEETFPDFGDIVFHSKNKFSGNVRINVPRLLYPEVAAIFREKAKEVIREESLFDTLERFFRF